jgi:hypothetical protein
MAENSGNYLMNSLQMQAIPWYQSVPPGLMIGNPNP